MTSVHFDAEGGASLTHRDRQPVNAVMLDAARKVAGAIEALGDNGFTVIGIDFAAPSRPTVRVQNCGKCQRLIHNGEAAYFGYGASGGAGPYREGQFQLGGCRVVWTEYGH